MHSDADDPTENLSGQVAAEKIAKMAKSARTCLFGTFEGHLPLTVRPMAVQTVDEAGDLWFLSGRSSQKNQHIAKNPHVQLLFANTGSSEYMTLYGKATISDERELRKKHWTPLAKAWFHQGVDDPEVTVICVSPESGYYWDTEHGKAVTLLQIAISAVTGKTMDGGLQGTIEP